MNQKGSGRGFWPDDPSSNRKLFIYGATPNPVKGGFGLNFRQNLASLSREVFLRQKLWLQYII